MGTQTITGAELNANPYLGKTKQIERPYADDPSHRYADPADLRRHQLQWDQAKAWADENDRARADHLAKIDADREAAASKRQADARADLESRLRQRFMANPAATVADWEAAKAGLIARELAEAPDPMEVRKRELLATGRYNLI